MRRWFQKIVETLIYDKRYPEGCRFPLTRKCSRDDRRWCLARERLRKSRTVREIGKKTVRKQ